MATGDQTEILGSDVVERVRSDIATALRRRPAHEVRLAGVVRALAPHSVGIRDGVRDAVEMLVRRGSYDRPLYVGLVRAMAESGTDGAAQLLAKAVAANEDAGGFATLSAACFEDGSELADALARVAASRHPHVAFAAEIARSARGESNGMHLTGIAPKIKEAHRISLCVELFLPLSRYHRLPTHVAPALRVLRDTERHLGRWLVLAEVATHANDPAPLEEATHRAKNGSSGARAAWSLVAWALSGSAEPPSTRPTVELVARLSDRPSADRDTTFLFRLAAARAPCARPMLESLTKTAPLTGEVGVRAASHLARDHGRADLLPAIESLAKVSKREDLRGMAIAALWDAGTRDRALDLARQAARSRSLPSAAWAALVRAAAEQAWAQPVIEEATFRRMQWGWLE
ncbi:MAG: hypothetical protein MUF54_19895 [Polyangiaceae bacterium]|nr:hypothetical protein [Polyangiaceae bacterium]